MKQENTMVKITFSKKSQGKVRTEVHGFYWDSRDKSPSQSWGHEGLKALHSLGQLPSGELQTVLIRNPKAVSYLSIHLGKMKNDFNFVLPEERFRRMGAQLVKTMLSERISSVSIQWESFLNEEAGLKVTSEEDASEFLQAFIEGALLASYGYRKYKTDKKTASTLNLEIVSDVDTKISKQALQNAEILRDGIFIARDLGNEPPNEFYPEIFAQVSQKLAREYKMKCTILSEKELERERMGLMLAVGQGSAHSPRLIVLEYNPEGIKNPKTLALVGKGLTFDSGGISIKPAAKMEDMKHDMCGASAVLGAALAIAKKKLPIKVICVIAAVENMPAGDALRPGDIVKSRSGKTVEVNNTDAEGRLVLADALDWVQDRKPDYVINAATLTGAILVALGKHVAGLMGNDEDLIYTLCQASELTHERVWELPLYSEYFEDLKSEYADLRNVGDSGNHGSIRAGMFLQKFIRDGVKWAHLDIAGVAYDHGVVPYSPRRGSSGWGVRLFVKAAELLCEEADLHHG